MFKSKYGVARHIYIPIVKRAVVDHAVSADWTPSAGDVKISKDGGATANVANLPVAIAMGNSAIWDFSLSATEMQAAQIVVTVADSATKAVEDTGFIIETYGHGSAQVVQGLAKNAAFTAFMVLMTDSTNHNPATGKTLTVTRSIDGAAFGAGTLGAVTEVAFGYYKFDFAAADLNGSVIVLRAVAAACDDRFVEIFTTP